MKKVVLAAVAAVSIGCGLSKPVVAPTVPNVSVGCVALDANTNQGVQDATCKMVAAVATTNGDGYGFLASVPPSPPKRTLQIFAAGYEDYSGDYAVHGGENILVHLTPVIKPLPSPPTHEQAVKVWTHGMQGMHVNCPPYGDIPWWEAAIAWVGDECRANVYKMKHDLGDTHMLVQLPTGKPLYNECCNAYSPDRFPALDWSFGETSFGDGRLADLIAEIRYNGFIPVIFPDELPDHALLDQTLAVKALLSTKYGNLVPQVGLWMTGWDGVFYGPWTQYQVQNFPAMLRTYCGDCAVGLEFSTGHIPMEAGWDMRGYDALFIEFERSVHTCNNWQITVRLLGEAQYHRPADDDWRLCGTRPPPYPRMPMMGPHGEIQTVCFEWKTYWYVRNQDSDAEVNDDRLYLIAEGCPAIG